MLPIELPAFVCHDAVQRAGGLAAHLASNLDSEAEMDQLILSSNHRYDVGQCFLYY